MVICISGLLSITACSKKNNSNGTSVDIINIGVTDSLSSVNPLLQDGTEVVKHTTSLEFLPLMELNSELEFVGQLADDITTEDNKTLQSI